MSVDKEIAALMSIIIDKEEELAELRAVLDILEIVPEGEIRKHYDPIWRGVRKGDDKSDKETS